MLYIQKNKCTNCPYKTGEVFKVERLLRSPSGLTGYYVCPHSYQACCRGFWDLHKDEFEIGSLVQERGLYQFVEDLAYEINGEVIRCPRCGYTSTSPTAIANHSCIVVVAS